MNELLRTEHTRHELNIKVKNNMNFKNNLN